MASITKYVNENFKNKLYEVSEKFVLDNVDDLRLSSRNPNIFEEFEVYDAEIMNVYAGNRDGLFIDIDILINVYISVKSANNHSDQEDTRNRWLRIESSGFLDSVVQNFSIKNVSSYQKGTYSQFKNPMSDELVPLIWKDNLEKEAEEFLKRHYPWSLEVLQAIDPYKLASSMGLTVVEKKITEDCSIFGQIYFQDLADRGIQAGTIIIDSELETIRNIGAVNNTIVHECVHWDKHRKAFELERAIAKELSNISTTLSPEQKSSNASATDWMEWQTQTLTPKIMMPRAMFKQEAEAVIKRLVEQSITKDMLDIIEKAIDDLARFFGVSKLSAKIRLVELGYDIAMGAFIYVDGKYVPTHYWKKGFLETNQTFSLSRLDVGIQLLSNADLKEKVDNGTYLFVESHYCLNDPKYIAYDIFDNPILTLYARHHMDECCIVFDISARVKVGNQALALTLVLNRDAGSDIQYNISYPVDKNLSLQEKAEFIKNHADDIEVALKEIPDDFGDALGYLIKWREITNEKLSETSGLTVETISRMKNNKINPKVKSVVAICVGLKLPPLLSYKLIDIAGFSLRYSKPEEMMYQIILTGCSSMSIYDCNGLLESKNLEPLVKEK